MAVTSYVSYCLLSCTILEKIVLEYEKRHPETYRQLQQLDACEPVWPPRMILKIKSQKHTATSV